MFGFGLVGLVWETGAERREREAMEATRRLPPLPWSPDMKFQSRLRLDGATWNPPLLFDTPPSVNCPWDKVPEGQYVDSPDGQWRYVNKILDKRAVLDIVQGPRRGLVNFSTDVVLPTLAGRRPDRQTWMRDPWMSYTPGEVFSLRPGVRLAKGHTVVAGLGLGYTLMDVTARKQVKRVTLVEKSQALLDWLLPVVTPKLGPAKLEVICGDAYEVLPELQADVAIVDIYETYGMARHDANSVLGLQSKCLGIGKVWCWGGNARG